MKDDEKNSHAKAHMCEEIGATTRGYSFLSANEISAHTRMRRFLFYAINGKSKLPRCFSLSGFLRISAEETKISALNEFRIRNVVWPKPGLTLPSVAESPRQGKGK